MCSEAPGAAIVDSLDWLFWTRLYNTFRCIETGPGPEDPVSQPSIVWLSADKDHIPEDAVAFLQYAPASGEIFGILKQMKETFETNLAASQKEEMENQKAYEDLKAAKEEEIAAGTSLADTKTTTLAATDEKKAQNSEDLEDTQASLEADTKFLANLKERCANMDQEYEERTKTRQLEIGAVSKALAFLSSDEAHDLFTRTFNFVQVQSVAQSQRRAAISSVLSRAAKKSQDPRLSTLATQARLDAFTKVLA